MTQSEKSKEETDQKTERKKKLYVWHIIFVQCTSLNFSNASYNSEYFWHVALKYHNLFFKLANVSKP